MEKKVPSVESNPQLKQIRKIQHHNLPNIPYEHQQVISNGAIYVVFLRLHMRSATGSAVGSWTCVPYCRWEVIHYIYFCKKKKKELCHWSDFQKSDDASKYRRPFKRPCQIFFFQDPDPPPTHSSGFQSRHPLGLNTVRHCNESTLYRLLYHYHWPWVPQLESHHQYQKNNPEMGEEGVF